MRDQESQVPQLFDPNAGAMLAAQNDAAAVARATQEVQAALVIAQRFPRDEVKAKSRVMQACARPELAEVAEYEYSRGGTKITGPTIDLLRAIANRWGNIRYGWTEVDRRDGYSVVRCFAWDLQSNGQAERTFNVRHWRDTSSGGYKLEDERDIYESMANQAARRVRACLEEVIDADVVYMAVDTCRLTLKNGLKGGTLADTAAKLVVEFAQFGVTQDMIEKKLQNKLDAISPNQIAMLRRVFKSLRDGVGTREEFFKPDAAAPRFDNGYPQAAPAAPAPAPAAPVQTPAPAPAPAAERKPRAKTPPPAAAAPAPAAAPAGGMNALVALRGLCANHTPPIGDAEVLAFLSDIGLTDGSAVSLDQVADTTLRTVVDNWTDFASRIAS